jgi:hypothetical protein
VNRLGRMEDYLDALRRELPGGRRFKGRVLAEVEDHLREGVRREREDSVLAPEAVQRVIERFGAPRLVARRFAEDLTGSGARAAAWAMVLATLGVMFIRFSPSPALGELLGMPANGYFEPQGLGLTISCRLTCVRPRTWRSSRSSQPSQLAPSPSAASGAAVGAWRPRRRASGCGFGHLAGVRRLRRQRRRGHRVHVPAGGSDPRLAIALRTRGLCGREGPDHRVGRLLRRPGGPPPSHPSTPARELERGGT